jgi:nucleoid-associated protein YgaU
MFFKGSRYEKVGDYIFKRIDGSSILLKLKRKIPVRKSKMIHTVAEGDRTDLLAYRFYRDPLKFWKIADANDEMNPEQMLTKPGDKIIIPPNDPD